MDKLFGKKEVRKLVKALQQNTKNIDEMDGYLDLLASQNVEKDIIETNEAKLTHLFVERQNIINDLLEVDVYQEYNFFFKEGRDLFELVDKDSDLDVLPIEMRAKNQKIRFFIDEQQTYYSEEDYGTFGFIENHGIEDVGVLCALAFAKNSLIGD